MRGSPRLLRIIALLGPFLMTVQGLYRRVDIQYPIRPHHRTVEVTQLPLKPRNPRFLTDFLQRAPRRILTQHSLHRQQVRIHPVRTNAADMGIPMMSR